MHIKIYFYLLLLAVCIINAVYANSTFPTPTTDDEEADDDEDFEDSSEIDDEEETNDEGGKIYKNPRNSPSTLCPRDEEQATLQGQKCLRKCSSDEDCKSKKKKCLCDGACGMSCIKPDRECPDLEHPPNGSVTSTGKLFGSQASYHCNYGYQVVGVEIRTCQADGHWSGHIPACRQAIYCLSPPTIDHARHNAILEQKTFLLDTQLQYYCHTGYVTNGFAKARCYSVNGQASWYGPDMSCDPISCGNPTEVAHGYHTGDCYTYGCKITYQCAESYEMVGKKERICQSDGAWTKEIPTCVLVTSVQCPPPEIPRHGKAIYTSCSYNSVVRYECRDGYNLVGESTRKCGADRKWSGNQPVCKEINCGHPGRLWNGWMENVEGKTTSGAAIMFRCHDGMLLEGNSSTLCLNDGNWSHPLPKCLAPCVIPHVTKGRVILLSKNDTAATSTVVTHGELLTVDCDPQYEFISTFLNVSCNNGTWSQMPKCEPARCPSLPKPPKHGMVSAPEMRHGMKAKYRCKDGYELKGSEFIECSFGNWTGLAPRCVEVFCPFPGTFDNGKILLVGNMGLYDYRPYVKKVANNKQIMYDCDKGFVLTYGPPGATCIGGNWSPNELPKCTLAEHPRFRWNRRRRSILMKDLKQLLTKNEFFPEPKITYPYRVKRDIIRKRFFINQKLLDILMKNKRTKNYAIEKFHRVKRAGLKSSKPATKALGGASGNHHNSNSHSSRRKGFNSKKRDFDSDDDPIPDPDNEISPDSSSKTLLNKTLKGNACEPLQNEIYVNIEIVKEGKEKNETYGSGTVVRMACGKGYILNMPENKTAKCVKGKWKSVKPMCNIVPCYIPETDFGIFKLHKPPAHHHDNNTTIDYDNPLNGTFEVENGQLVDFSCEEGYEAEGSTNMRCYHGEWAVTMFPECYPAPCYLPPLYHGEYLDQEGDSIANGSSVRFQCETDYHPSTSQPVECFLGEFLPKRPYCLKEGEIIPEPHYLGGKDIVRGGDITVIEYGRSNGKPCGPPAKVRGSLVYRNGEQLINDEFNFPDGSEVTFNCIESIMGEKTTWKIVCEDGSWIGRSLSCDELMNLHQTSLNHNNSTCIFRNQEANVISFYNDQEIKEDIIEFPAGTILVSRCIDIGKYVMVGPKKRRCMGGEWDGSKPSCYGLNQENDYSMEKPPTILFRHQKGPIAQSNDGKLIVYPGTTLHMECLWMRRFGNPKWNISHESRQYQVEWSTDPARDANLEYRLTIIDAVKEDSGLFTCSTPARYTHSVEVLVKAVHCPNLPQRRGLTANIHSTKMNSVIKFYCVNGNSLIGAPEILCLPSGNWSAPFPVCESIECGDVGSNLGSHLKVTVVSREVGGRAVFSCDSNYGLRGPVETICQTNGEWATPFPSCEEVHCPDPQVPENGYIQSSGPFKAGTVVQFSCNERFMMEGQPLMACQENSRWSGKVPKCVQACQYPGTIISGKMSPVTFYYKIGENITFNCLDGLILKGASMLKCLKNGKWSNAIPTCVSPLDGYKN